MCRLFFVSLLADSFYQKQGVTIVFIWKKYIHLQGFLFFLPHLIWGQFEGGKMTTISKEVMIGTSQSENYDKKVDNVAKSVSQYINMKGAGHRNYGLGYVFSQVLK